MYDFGNGREMDVFYVCCKFNNVEIMGQMIRVIMFFQCGMILNYFMILYGNLDYYVMIGNQGFKWFDEVCFQEFLEVILCFVGLE